MFSTVAQLVHILEKTCFSAAPQNTGQAWALFSPFDFKHAKLINTHSLADSDPKLNWNGVKIS